ncbi:MAG: hypothetical protein HWE14_13895 [Flavobacteriia bacterium]|nr:hypothetical protein [Flavobacteriia bacterium]
MNRTISLLTALLVYSLGYGQGHASHYNVGIFAGTTHTFDDVSSEFQAEAFLKEARPQIGFHGDYYFNPHIGLGAGFSFAQFHGDDANYGANRGLSYNTYAALFDFRATLNILPWGRFHYYTKWTTYVFIGGGVGAFNSTISLPPSTDIVNVEGQTTTKATISIGGGFKHRVSYNNYLSIEGIISQVPDDTLEGFTTNNTQYPDYYFGFRFVFGWMNALKPGTF